MKIEDIDEEEFGELEKERLDAVWAVVSILGFCVVIALTAGVIFILKSTAPDAKKAEAMVTVLPSVKVAVVKPVKGRVLLEAEGVVESSRTVTLMAEVMGKVVEVSPDLVAGGLVREGQLLVRIEEADYRASLEQAKSQQERASAAVKDAELAIQTEEARRDQSMRDWEKLGRGEPSDLLLRKPQLASARARWESAKADVESAKAEVERALRNVERTVIRAPFDGTVRSESVEIGAVVGQGLQLATLFSESALEVELPLKLEDYALLERDEMGKPVGKVELRGRLGVREMIWPGRILRTTGEVESGAMTAGVVVGVQARDGEGELSLPPPGLFVRCVLEGQAMGQLLEVPREAVREGNRVVVVDADSRLTLRVLTIQRSGAKMVLVSEGVAAGERVVLTRLTMPSEGMEVEVLGENGEGEGGE